MTSAASKVFAISSVELVKFRIFIMTESRLFLDDLIARVKISGCKDHSENSQKSLHVLFCKESSTKFQVNLEENTT